MKFEKTDAVTLIVELVRADKIKLPNQTTYNAANRAEDDDAILIERARVQAKYLRCLLEELTKEDEKSE